MPWTERQHAMLREMGIALPPGAVAERAAAIVGDAAVDPPPVPAAVAPAAPRDVAVAALRPPSAPTPAAPVATAAPAVAFEAAAAQAPSGPRVVAAPPGPGAGPALDWPALREAVAACTACGLCRTRRQTVFGVGHEQAHWMVVGEAPGEQEDLRGEPFVGPAGQLLDAMLRALGLTREPAEPARQVYIANTLKCRPPRNRNPEPAELASCEPFLLRQIELVRPRMILAMGRFAVQALLRTDEAIGKLRGRVHTYAGVPLVVTYHPAYLLRQPADKAKAWDDLCLAADTLERAPPRP